MTNKEKANAHIESIREWWFNPESTVMNWSGMVKGNPGFLDRLLGIYRSDAQTEQLLKETVFMMVAKEIRRAYEDDS